MFPRAVSVLAASLMFAVFNVLPSQGGDELDGGGRAVQGLGTERMDEEEARLFVGHPFRPGDG